MPWETSSRRQSLPSDWQDRRRRVLTRDGYRCTATDDGVRCPRRATDVDHARHRDDHSLDALASLCREHHKRKTAREAAAGLRAVAARRRAPVERHPGLVD